MNAPEMIEVGEKTEFLKSESESPSSPTEQKRACLELDFQSKPK